MRINNLRQLAQRENWIIFSLKGMIGTLHNYSNTRKELRTADGYPQTHLIEQLDKDLLKAIDALYAATSDIKTLQYARKKK